jgi:hypothetical protein
MPNADQLQSVLSAMMSAFDVDTLAAYAEFSGTPAATKAILAAQSGEFDEFYFAVQYPASQVIDGLLMDQFPQQHATHFLFKNSQFIERHVRYFIEKYEGSACGADKSRTILRSIFRHLQTGNEIVFNYSQEFTYHLPKKVFTTHTRIMQFFEALRALHAGNPEGFEQ